MTRYLSCLLASFIALPLSAAPLQPMDIPLELTRQTDELTLQSAPEVTSVYQGQAFTVRYTLTTQLSPLAFQALHLSIPELAHTDFEVFTPSEQPVARARNTMNIGVNGHRLFSQRTVEDQQQVTLSFKRRIKPRHSGIYELSPATALIEINPDKAAYGPFQFRAGRLPARLNHHFSDHESEPEWLSTNSKPLVLEVKPLPAGDPDHFSGMVGQPDIKMSLSSEQLTAGEPIQVTLSISHPDVQGSQWLDLRNQPQFLELFNIPGKPAPIEMNNNTGLFRQTLFPKISNITKIPPVVVNYFDPETLSYKDYITPAVPITMAKSLSSVQKQNSSSNSTVRNGKQKAGILDHVWEMKAAEAGLHKQNPTRYWALLLLPPFLVISRSADKLRQRWLGIKDQFALNLFKHQLLCSNDPLQALSLYLHKKSGIEPSSFTIQTLLKELERANIDFLLIERLEHWLKNYQLRFTHRKSSAKRCSIPELLHLVIKIDKQWLWRQHWNR